MCERDGGSESETEEELEWKEHRDERRLERKESEKNKKKTVPRPGLNPLGQRPLDLQVNTLTNCTTRDNW